MRAIRHALDRWIDHQDPTTFEAFASVRSWSTNTILAALLVGLGAFVPVTHRFVGLDGRVAAVAYLLPLAGALGLAAFRRVGDSFSRRAWLTVVLTSSATKMFCVVLMISSNLLGAALYMSAFLVATAVHGYMLKVRRQEPFVALGTALAAGVGLALAPTAAHRVLLLSTAIPAILLELSLGAAAVRQLRILQREQRLEAAVVAQQWQDEAARADALSASLVEMMTRNHDARNALLAVQMGVEALAGILPEVEGPSRKTLGRIERTLRQGLERVRSLVTEQLDYHVPPANDQSRRESVSVASVLKEIREGLAGPVAESLAIRVEIPEGEDLRVIARGGRETLVRILDNLVLNARQGDGVRGATRVWLSAHVEPMGRSIRIEVEDDGPGFSEEQLSRPIAAFDSSKLSGTGLGLYTAERLARANGGTIHRRNRPVGGACVSIVLPREVGS